MKKNYTIICAVAAVVFDLIACLGDSNAVVYNLFMGLCCAAFCAYVAGLFTVNFSKKEYVSADKKTVAGTRKAA